MLLFYVVFSLCSFEHSEALPDNTSPARALCLVAWITMELMRQETGQTLEFRLLTVTGPQKKESRETASCMVICHHPSGELQKKVTNSLAWNCGLVDLSTTHWSMEADVGARQGGKALWSPSRNSQWIRELLSSLNLLPLEARSW